MYHDSWSMQHSFKTNLKLNAPTKYVSADQITDYYYFHLIYKLNI